MNWKETLEAIKPLVSTRGYMEARIFVTSRKTTTERGIFFNREVETKFELKPAICANGVVIRVVDKSYDFTIVY